MLLEPLPSLDDDVAHSPLDERDPDELSSNLELASLLPTSPLLDASLLLVDWSVVLLPVDDEDSSESLDDADELPKLESALDPEPPLDDEVSHLPLDDDEAPTLSSDSELA